MGLSVVEFYYAVGLDHDLLPTLSSLKRPHTLELLHKTKLHFFLVVDNIQQTCSVFGLRLLTQEND